MMHVSVVIPCRNEASYIGTCLASIVGQDYPKDRLEVLVVDGMSSDGTRATVAELAGIHPFIFLLDNPKKIVPAALNLGIRASRGEIIVRMDAHTVYSEDYLSTLVRWLEREKVDNVGGRVITRPGGDTLIARAIAFVLSSPFGVGNSWFRTGGGDMKPRLVDTVPFGAYRREVFEKIGLFDERLARNQDIEFNKRLLRAGGKILLVPEIVSYYYARATLKDLVKNNFENGLWVVCAAWCTRDVTSLSLRHFVPLLFILGLFGGAVLSPMCNAGRLLLAGIAASYCALSLAFSAAILRNSPMQFFIMPVLFLTLHFSYGLGSLWGIAKLRRVGSRQAG